MDDATHSRTRAMGRRSASTGSSLDRVTSFPSAVPIVVGARYAPGGTRCDNNGLGKKDYSRSRPRRSSRETAAADSGAVTGNPVSVVSGAGEGEPGEVRR